MAERPRVVEFDTVEFEDNDWDGPHPHGEFLTYTSKNDFGLDQGDQEWQGGAGRRLSLQGENVSDR